MLHHALYIVLELLAFHASQPGEEIQVVYDADIVPDHVLLHADAQVPPGRCTVSRDAVAVHSRVSVTRLRGVCGEEYIEGGIRSTIAVLLEVLTVLSSVFYSRH